MDVNQEPKYDCGEDGRLIKRDTLVAIPDDEPVFIIRAQDNHAVAMLRYYQTRVDNTEHKNVVQARLEAFKKFRSDNPDRMKEPDTSPEIIALGGGGNKPAPR